MKNLFLFSLCAMLFMASCKKDDKLEITFKEHGSLTVTVTNSDGTPIANEGVFLYNFSSIMDSKKTDENGMVNFGSLINGNYNIVINDVKIGSKEFTVNQGTQVIAANGTSLTIVPEEYVGTVNVKMDSVIYDFVTGDYEYIPVQGATVYAITLDNYIEYRNKIEDLIANAHTQGSTNAEGRVSLTDIPSSQQQVIFYYLDVMENWSLLDDYVSVGKWQEVNLFETTN